MMAAVLYLFDAPADLDPVFRDNGFRPYGRQSGAWCQDVADRLSDEARDLEYELKGVGLNPRWRQS